MELIRAQRLDGFKSSSGLRTAEYNDDLSVTLAFPPFFHFKCPICQNNCKDMKICLKFQVAKSFSSYTLRIKNILCTHLCSKYTYHTSLLKILICLRSCQSRSCPIIALYSKNKLKP